MNAIAEDRARRLAEALSTISSPLQPLLEYAGELEKRMAAENEIEVICIAALLRACTAEVKHEMLQSLDALEEAATCMAAP